MASIKQISERKFKITVSNGYRADGRKISRAKTVTVPDSVRRKSIPQYIAHTAEEFERTVKNGFSEDAETPFQVYAEHWLERQVKYAPSTLENYRRKLKAVYPFIGQIPLCKLRPIVLENMLNEQAVLFERECKGSPKLPDKTITLEKYIDIWLKEVAPNKLAVSTLTREKQDIVRILPHLGHYKLSELRPEHFRKFYADMRKEKNMLNGKPLSEYTVEGIHACLCGILSDAMEGGYLDHNPAWRTYRYSGIRKEKKIADEETVQKLIAALEQESIKYELYYKLIIATGMRRGECCGLKWKDINYEDHSIHVCRNVVKVSREDIVVKPPKTAAGDRYVYFSPEMATLLEEFRTECRWKTEAYDNRELTDDDYIFRRQGEELPMTPSTFTWRFKMILKKNGLPEKLNVHSLRHTNASLLIAGGTDVTTVAGLLGHSQPSTTLDIYSHAFDKNKKAASKALQEGLEI